MRGIGEKPITPSTDNYNPLYQDPEAKRNAQTESQQSESKKLAVLVPEQKKSTDSKRGKIQSLLPRSPRTPRSPEIVTLMHARPENPVGGLTRIKPPAIETGTINSNLGSSGSEGFPKITPRTSSRPQHGFLIRPQNIATEPIDESGESSENAPKTESAEEHRVEVTARPQFTTAESTLRAREPFLPLAPTRAKAASTNRADLRRVVPSREKKEMSASEHSWEAPSEDAGFWELDKEHIDLMPLTLEKPTGGLTKIKPPPLFERPRGLQSPRSKISTTLRRPVMEKKIPGEPLGTAHSGEEEIEELGPVRAIELVEVHRTFTADEYAALLMAENKTSRIKESGTLARLGTLGRRSVLPSARNTALRVTKSIGSMIRELNDPGSASKTMRALNILYYVLSGESRIDRSLHPEIELLAEYLGPLSPKDKFGFLKHLYKEVEEHFDFKQRSGLESAFDEVERIQRDRGHFDFYKITMNLEGRLIIQARKEAETDQ